MRRADLSLHLTPRIWEETFGGNNKYPGVGVDNLSGDGALGLAEKIELLGLILAERQQVLGFFHGPNLYSPNAEAALGACKGNDTAPIFIPSGGRSTRLFVGGEDGFNDTTCWWMRMAKLGVPVFLLVALEEFEAYKTRILSHQDYNLFVVGYPGFGIGCGRFVAVQLAVNHECTAVITDDRTNNVYVDPSLGYNPDEPVNSLKHYDDMIKEAAAKDFLCSVMTKGDLNIMSIVKGQAAGTHLGHQSNGMFSFPPCFLASKEDKSLSALFKFAMGSTIHDDLFMKYFIRVSTDTRNPDYTNGPDNVSKTQDRPFTLLCNSAFFCDTTKYVVEAETIKAERKSQEKSSKATPVKGSKSARAEPEKKAPPTKGSAQAKAPQQPVQSSSTPATVPLTLQRWHDVYEFNNRRDIIKMQESAIYQLIESIITDPQAAGYQGPIFDIIRQHFWAKKQPL